MTQIYPFVLIGHSDDHKPEAYVAEPRIVGGHNATQGELPFQVSHINDKGLLHSNIVFVLRSTAKLSGNCRVYFLYFNNLHTMVEE